MIIKAINEKDALEVCPAGYNFAVEVDATDEMVDENYRFVDTGLNLKFFRLFETSIDRDLWLSQK